MTERANDKSEAKRPGKSARSKRLADALRDNLRKRKEQARARSAGVSRPERAGD